MTLIRDPEWLMNHLSDDRLRVVDCQYDLSNEDKGRQRYDEEHIPAAVFADIGNDLSLKIGEHGGRHPIPSKEEFVCFMQKAGIGQDTIIIAYDGGEGAFAARFLWLSQLYGYKQVYVLDGGLKAWKELGYPLTADQPDIKRSEYCPADNKDVLSSYEEVKALSMGEGEGLLIDSREEGRFKGLYEPIDRKCGHIPNALNFVWMDNLEEGRYLDGNHLTARFQEIDPDTPLTVYCGSGITACVNYIALKQAGFKAVKVYAGSFSDWISYDENPVVKD